ncbi:MAG TPA: MFS transporter, partial [Burkholderiales bacterium]|nr:MFS transporter [Burkholderiales bacterium]
MSERSQFRLLAERRFGPFFGVQFLGAMNDNAFKQALVILLAYQTSAFTALSSDTLQNVAQALFILPFLLFSATAGQLADKYEKRNLITLIVALELVIMLLGAAGLLLKDLTVLLAALFLGGTQSAFFGPVKYAYLPQHLHEAELVGGNALVETGTSIAILVGMLVGGWLVIQQGWGVAGVGVLTCLIAAGGLALSRLVPPSPAPDPQLRVDWNPVSATLQNLRFAAANRTVFLSIIGVSWFWFYGAMLVTQLPNLAKNVLGGSESLVTLLLIVFSLGIGAGSLLCERLSGHKVELGLVPFGSIGLTLFGADLAFALGEPQRWRVLADLCLIGAFGGFYIVPLYALIQSRSDARQRSRIIAANNILNALFMVAAAAIAVGLFAAGLSIPQLILVLALMNAAVALYIYDLVPEFLMRFMVWMLIHTVYRLRKLNLERIPDDGPAIVVCNHVSYVDALVISAACRRPIRWVMDHRIFRVPLLSFFFRTARAIPIAPAREDTELLERAYQRIREELDAGELVGIFPEGRLTSDGNLSEFRGGVMRILKERPVPVIPMALSGLWRSLFARNPDKLRHARHLFPRVRFAVGEAFAPDQVTPEKLHAAVLELRG